MRLSIIAAMSEERVIGISNALPWRLPADLANFKRITLGHTLLMGRKTFESIGRPLRGRKTVVITRNRDFDGNDVWTAATVEKALRLAEQLEPPDGEVFIAGGAEIYRQTIHRADRMYLTIVHGHFRGDAWFPKFELESWTVTFREDRKADERNGWDLTFQVLDRAG